MTKKLNDIIWIKNEHDHIVNNQSNIKNIKELLDSTGNGFCLAKFTQVTMHLGTGMTHACHHPVPHKIPLEEIESSPNALFNTQHLKQARKEMLSGDRPEECDYCWRMEDSNNPSDRFYKSIESWALSDHDKIKEQGWEVDYYPRYLEVDFSNVCNFSCLYCGPEFSSVWVDDLKTHGPIKVLENTQKVQWVQGWQPNLDDLNYKNREFNPYIDAFWKWFPEAYKHLKVYRITGGEPLLSKETFRSIDWFIKNPNTEIEFSINSNLGVPDKIWNQFVEKIKILSSGNYVKKFSLFTSIDGWGERAEYIRPGLDFELFKKRYEQILELGNIRCIVMCTFNLLSITSIKELLEWQADLKRKYNLDKTMSKWEKEFDFNLGGERPHVEREKLGPSHYSIVGIDIPYLRSPALLDAHYADKKLIEKYLIPAMNYMTSNAGNITWGLHQGFEQYEIEKMKRIVMEAMHFNKTHGDSDGLVIEHRAKFYDFVNEIDKRKGTNFLKTFPEMTEFYELCRAAKDQFK
jgi:hypothetical protein